MLYGHDYYNFTLRKNSARAEEICHIRWDFISSVNPEIVLDFGSGTGWFGAFAPEGVQVDTLDVNPCAHATGIRHAGYDIITLWDVFEHIEDFTLLKEVLKMTRFVALSTPILPKGQSLFTWKHFKKGEHLYQFTEQSLEDIFTEWGFRKISEGHPENIIRQDIYSVIYEKIKEHPSRALR